MDISIQPTVIHFFLKESINFRLFLAVFGMNVGEEEEDEEDDERGEEGDIERWVSLVEVVFEIASSILFRSSKDGSSMAVIEGLSSQFSHFMMLLVMESNCLESKMILVL
jgi:hypothetical protein